MLDRASGWPKSSAAKALFILTLGRMLLLTFGRIHVSRIAIKYFSIFPFMCISVYSIVSLVAVPIIGNGDGELHVQLKDENFGKNENKWSE